MKSLEQQLKEADEVCYYYSLKMTTQRLDSETPLTREEYKRLDKLEEEAMIRHLNRLTNVNN
jgi:hypothetical protein